MDVSRISLALAALVISVGKFARLTARAGEELKMQGVFDSHESRWSTLHTHTPESWQQDENQSKTSSAIR